MGLIVNFSDFENISASNLGLSDYLVGFASDPDRETRISIGELVSFLESVSTNDLFTVLNLNSASWNSVYSTVKSLSDDWEESQFISPLQIASAGWNSTYTTTNVNSAFWDDVYNNVAVTSAARDSVYSTVNAISSNVVSVYTSMIQTSSNWDNTYTDFSTNSSSYVKSNHTGNVTIAGTLSATALDLNQLTALSSVPVEGTRTLTTLFLSITVGTSSLYIPLYQ